MKKTTTTIQITDTDIKLLQARKVQGREVVTFCDIHSIATDADEDIVKILKEMITALPISPGEVLFLVSRRQVILKQMRLVSGSDDETNDMIGLQLINKLPYPIEDVVYRYHMLKRDADGYSRVLVIIIPKETSLRYCRILHKAGIKNAKLVLDSVGICEWMNYQQERENSETHRPTVLINIDLQHSEVCFCHDKNLLFSRSLPYGEEHLRSNDVVGLTRQIRLSLQAYKEESLGMPVEEMLVLSVSDQGRVFAEHLAKDFGIQTQIVSPLKHIYCAQNMDRSMFENNIPSSMTAALGFLVSSSKHHVSLVPERIHKEKQKKAKRFKQARFALFTFIIGAAVISGQFYNIHRKQRSLKAIKKEIGYLQPQLKETKQKRGLVEFFDRKLTSRHFVPELIDELILLMPEEISLRTLSLDKQKKLTMQGYAVTQKDVTDFQMRLVQSKRFHSVDLKFATKRKIANMSVMDFKVITEFGDEGDVR